MKNRKALSVGRVVQVAEEAFTEHLFEDVSVSEIARRAHCSTATLYDAFGSKEDLFRYVIGRRRRVSWPVEPAADDDPALASLITFVHRRMQSLGSDQTQAMARAMVQQSAILAEEVIEGLDMLIASLHSEMERWIAAAIEEGSMRSNPIDGVRYLLCAASAYEIMLFPAYGVRRPIDYAGLLRMAFTPLITESGKTILEGYLSRLGTETQDMPPSSRRWATTNPAGARRAPRRSDRSRGDRERQPTG